MTTITPQSLIANIDHAIGAPARAEQARRFTALVTLLASEQQRLADWGLQLGTYAMVAEDVASAYGIDDRTGWRVDIEITFDGYPDVWRMTRDADYNTRSMNAAFTHPFWWEGNGSSTDITDPITLKQEISEWLADYDEYLAKQDARSRVTA